MTDDEKDLPGLTVGKLREAMDGMDDSLPVIIRSEEFTGGIISAAPEESCSGLGFVLDCSNDESDFE